MLIPNSKIYRYISLGVLAIVLILIVRTFLDYGVTWDEELQSQYGQAIRDYYASGFKDLRYNEIFNLYLYGGLFDGLAAAIDHYTPFLVYDTRHFLNALFGLLGLWGTWRLGRILGGDLVGMLALILCATTPMYYGHMFNNPKDIPFAAGVVWSLYYMITSYSKPHRSTLVKLGLAYGLTLGVRVGGAMLFGFWLMPLFVPLILEFNRDPQRLSHKRIIQDIGNRLYHIVLPVGLLAYGVMLICWPWAQQNPILNPLRALTEFSNFPQDVQVLLDGTTYQSTQLPWFYVPLYFGIQLPELLLFLLATMLVFLPKIWRHFTFQQKQGFTLILLMACFPILYAVLRHPALYDTVRHFLFAVPIMCVASALAARALFVWCIAQFRQHWSRRAVGAGLSIAFFAFVASQIIVMVRLHPYEYIFANQFTGGVQGAYGKYESDYWGSSFKEAAQKIQELVASEGGVPPGKIFKIAICGPWASAMIYLPPDYEPVVANEPAEFFLSTTRWRCQNMRPGKEVIRVQRMGVPLSIVKDLRNGFEHYPGNAQEKK